MSAQVDYFLLGSVVFVVVIAVALGFYAWRKWGGR